jgi:hypothetical protein
MALKFVPWFLGTGSVAHPTELLRNLLKELTSGRSGVFKTGEMTLTPSAVAMQLTIGPFGAALLGNSSTAQGSYFTYSEASENIAWPAAAGSARIDSLILRVIDTQYGADASPQGAYWEVVSGTPSGSPVAVADIEFAIGGSKYRPGAWYRVADYRINAGTTNLAAAATVTNYVQTVNTETQRVEKGLLLLDTIYATASGSFAKANYVTGKRVKVRVQGGGGGAGGAAGAGSGTGCGGCGGAGAYAEAWYDFAELGSPQAYTVGTAGAGGAAGNNNGTAGGTSTFLNTTCPGGAFGAGVTASTASQAAAKGQGADATGSRISMSVGGGDGMYGRTLNGDNLLVAKGGDAFLGRGAGPNGSSSSNALPPSSGYGGGGVGGYAAVTSRAGSAGSPGIIIIEVWG